MSMFAYISFPRKVDKSCLKSKIDPSLMFTVGELRGTAWESIYGQLPDDMTVYLGNNDDFNEISIHDRGVAEFNNVFKNQFIYGFGGGTDDVCRKQLYDLVKFNTKLNEIVEIYSDWVDNRNIFHFGPPIETRGINLEQVLTSELLDARGKIKIEICHTK